MTTPATNLVENPWKKRRKGPQQFMPPSRALLAQVGETTATATWIKWFSGGWKCASTTKGLRWMQGMTDPIKARGELAQRGIKWRWIEPNTAKVLRPPF